MLAGHHDLPRVAQAIQEPHFGTQNLVTAPKSLDVRNREAHFSGSVELEFDRAGLPFSPASWGPLSHPFQLSADLTQGEGRVRDRNAGNQGHDAVVRRPSSGFP